MVTSGVIRASKLRSISVANPDERRVNEIKRDIERELLSEWGASRVIRLVKRLSGARLN